MLSDSCSASSLNKGTWLAIFWKHGSTRKCPKPTWVFASAATCRKSRQESARHQAGVRTGEAVLVLYAGDSCGPDGAARRQGLAHARGSRGTGHPGWTGTRTQLRRRHDDRRAVSGQADCWPPCPGCWPPCCWRREQESLHFARSRPRPTPLHSTQRQRDLASGHTAHSRRSFMRSFAICMLNSQAIMRAHCAQRHGRGDAHDIVTLPTAHGQD